MSLAFLAVLSIIFVCIALATANSTLIQISIIVWIVVMLLGFSIKKIYK
jgi:hypothetical protein